MEEQLKSIVKKQNGLVNINNGIKRRIKYLFFSHLYNIKTSLYFKIIHFISFEFTLDEIKSLINLSSLSQINL
jgi:hypothetical protein